LTLKFQKIAKAIAADLCILIKSFQRKFKTRKISNITKCYGSYAIQAMLVYTCVQNASVLILISLLMC